jgi:hypothetical protein
MISRTRFSLLSPYNMNGSILSRQVSGKGTSLPIGMEKRFLYF